MPLKPSLLLLAASLAATSGAFAGEPDDGYAWINNCMAANMKKGASDDVAHSYCACIDHEMGDDVLRPAGKGPIRSTEAALNLG